MKHYLPIPVLLIVLNLAVAQPEPPKVVPISVPPMLKAIVGKSTPLVIENPTAKMTWIVYPTEGIAVWREHSDDTKLYKLRIEIFPGADGKPLRRDYGLIINSEGEQKLCVVSTDGSDPLPKPDPPPKPIEEDVSAQLKILTLAVKDLAGRVSALEKVPTPTAKVASVTFVVFAPTNATAAVTEDAGFRAWLQGSGLKVYGITSKEQFDANPTFKNNVTAPPPCIVLQDADANIITAAPLTNIAIAKLVITPHLTKGK